ncbi:MAG: hypothetical protein HOY75_05780, partial [Streptomyces sp.]|nr:hypothetical protein [Streptomyces sp.]
MSHSSWCFRTGRFAGAAGRGAGGGGTASAADTALREGQEGQLAALGLV